MNCPTCGSDLDVGQKFCPECGKNVGALTLPAPPAGPLPADAPTTAALPPIAAARVTTSSADAPAVAPPIVAPPPVAPPTVVAPVSRLAPPLTDSFAIVEQTVPIAPADDPVPTHEVPSWVNSWATPVRPNAAEEPTAAQPRVDMTLTAQYVEPGPPTAAVPYPVGYAPTAVTVAGRGSIALAVVAGFAGVVAIVAAFVPMLTVTTDAPIPDAGDYKINDLSLGTNMVVAVVVVGLCMLGGGILAVFGRRIGAGLAAGAAVAIAPLVVVIWGQIDVISRQAQANAFAVAGAGGGGTFFRSKQGAGLWVLIAAAALGLVALLISLVQAGADGRPQLNTFIGLGGALATVAAAVGQMIPGDSTTFGDNFDTTLGTRTFVYGRIAMIALVAIAGAVGFLCSNRWGIGLALGGASIWVWQWLSSIAEIGDSPLPPGFVALGTTDLKPHIVTTFGVVAMLVLAALAILTAPKSRPLAP